LKYVLHVEWNLLTIENIKQFKFGNMAAVDNVDSSVAKMDAVFYLELVI